MPRKKETKTKDPIEEVDILNDVFEINNNIELTKEDEKELEEWKEVIYEHIKDNGTEDFTNIKEIVLDSLLKNKQDNLIQYLSLAIDTSIKSTLKDKLDDDDFLKIEERETSDDFFVQYLKDDLINDIVMSMLGYERKSDGSKEIFIKKRSAKIPTSQVIAIGDILKVFFNKVAFLSKKDDIEQAHIILHTYDQIFDIILEIPYQLCDTKKSIELLGMVSVKLTNAIGLSDKYREDLLDTMKEAYKSLTEKKNKDLVPEND